MTTNIFATSHNINIKGKKNKWDTCVLIQIVLSSPRTKQRELSMINVEQFHDFVYLANKNCLLSTQGYVAINTECILLYAHTYQVFLY